MLSARSSPTVEYLPIPFQELFTDTVKKAALTYHASRWGVNAPVPPHRARLNQRPQCRPPVRSLQSREGAAVLASRHAECRRRIDLRADVVRKRGGGRRFQATGRRSQGVCCPGAECGERPPSKPPPAQTNPPRHCRAGRGGAPAG